MDLPEVCFCGCGEPRSKLDTANAEGFVLAIELSRYVSYLSVMKAAAYVDRRGFSYAT